MKQVASIPIRIKSSNHTALWDIFYMVLTHGKRKTGLTGVFSPPRKCICSSTSSWSGHHRAIPSIAIDNRGIDGAIVRIAIMRGCPKSSQRHDLYNMLPVFNKNRQCLIFWHAALTQQSNPMMIRTKAIGWIWSLQAGHFGAWVRNRRKFFVGI